MELRQLRYFTKIADMGSLSGAARALHISQPSLSYQIAQLEAQVGKRLLLRQPSGVRMTVEGEALYREALQILRQVDGIQGAVDSAHAQLSGRVTVAMAHTQAMQYALPLILKVRELYPCIQLEVFDGTSVDMLRAVGSGQKDLAVLVWDHEAQVLDSQPVLEEELFLVSRTEDAPCSDTIARSEVHQLPLILPSRDQTPALYEFELGIDSSSQMRADSITGRNIIVANSVGIYRQAVLAGVAHSLQPWGALYEEIQSGLVKATPLSPRIFRKVWLGTARGAPLSQATRAVRKLLLSVIEERLSGGFVRGRLLAPDLNPEGLQHSR